MIIHDNEFGIWGVQYGSIFMDQRIQLPACCFCFCWINKDKQTMNHPATSKELGNRLSVSLCARSFNLYLSLSLALSSLANVAKCTVVAYSSTLPEFHTAFYSMLQHTVVRQAQHTSYNQIYHDIIYFRNGGYPNRWMVCHGNSYQNGWFGRTTSSGNLYISNHENPSQHISKAPYRTNPEGPFGERRSTMGRRCKVNSGAKGPGTTAQHIYHLVSVKILDGGPKQI